MNRYLTAKALLILAMSALVFPASAQQVFQLNEITGTAPNVKSKSSPVFTTRINTSHFEEDRIEVGSTLELQTSPEEIRRLKVTRKSNYLPGTTSYITREEGGNGGIFSFTYASGRLSGILFDPASPDQELTMQDGRQVIFKRNPAERNERACGLDHDHSEDFFTSLISEDEQMRKGFEVRQDPVLQSLDDQITIDLLLVYTEAAERWALFSSGLGLIENTLAQAVNLSQTALDNSNTGVTLRVVHSAEIAYDETTDDISSGQRLCRITTSPNFIPSPGFCTDSRGYMNEIHELRDLYGADMVSAFMDLDDVGGIAWVVTDLEGDPRYAFNLNRIQQMATGLTLMHEIGHNLGSFHSRTQQVGAAPARGGVFAYSVGFQQRLASYVTVMAYTETGLEEAPVFSSPDLFWEGQPAGTASRFSPENTARSIREVKRTVAAYRPTKVDPPVAGSSTDLIEVELNQGEDLTVPLEITNSGIADLHWEIDFDFQNMVLTKNQDQKRRIEGVEEIIHRDFNVGYESIIGVADIRKAKSLSDSPIYSTSFEEAPVDSFAFVPAVNEWRGLTGGDEVPLNAINPSDGSIHLRLGGNGDTNGQYIQSPFFGRLPFGNYTIEMDFMISGADVDAESFDIYFFDSKTGALSSGIVIGEGRTLFAYTQDEQGEGGFFSTPAVVSADQYHSLRIEYAPQDEQVHYYLDGELATSNPYVNGFTPDEMWVLHRQNFQTTYFDVDNIRISQGNTPFDWLQINQMAGVLQPAGSAALNLNFSTENMLPGNYDAILLLRSNDPNQPVITVPLSFVVNGTVSSEGNENPTELSLEQNYPNPFNPSTTIQYQLNQATDVQLSVFNIQGQKVATLVDQSQAAGRYSISFNAEHLSSGIYVYTLKTAESLLSRRMVLIK
jgi:hypothetical protein